MVFEPVEVLVTLATNLASVWLFFLHAKCSGVWCGCLWVDNRKRAIRIVVQLLVVVAMLNKSLATKQKWWESFPSVTYSFVIFQTILVLVRLFATNNWAPVGLRLLVWKDRSSIRNACKHLLFAYPSSNVAIWTILRSTELEVGI